MKTKILALSLLLCIIGISFKPKTKEVKPQPVTASQTTDFQKMITAKVFIKLGRESDFLSAAQVIIGNTRKEEGCLGYMLYQDPFEKGNFIFVENYKNQAAIDAHFAAPYFKEFGTKTADMTSRPTEIKIFDIAGVK